MTIAASTSACLRRRKPTSMKMLGLAVLVMAGSSAWAQFGSAGAPPTMPGWSSVPRNFHGELRSGRSIPGSRSNVIFLGQPWLDTYNSSQPGTTYIVLQPPAPVAAKPQEESQPITPLMIEWRGDRFVRMGADSPPSTGPADYAATKSRQTSSVARSAEVEPVVLIFRDGHSEKVRDYSIVGGRLYTSTDYFQSGSWMRTIKLSELDLLATIDVNRQAGVRFVLPSGPNVVVTRF